MCEDVRDSCVLVEGSAACSRKGAFGWHLRHVACMCDTAWRVAPLYLHSASECQEVSTWLHSWMWHLACALASAPLSSAPYSAPCPAVMVRVMVTLY